MLHRLKRLFIRQWPPIVAFILSVALLAKMLAPRPFETVRLLEEANVYASRYEVSPDERYVIAIDSDVTLLDLRTGKKLLSFPHTNDQYGFDREGRLIWLELKHVGFLFSEYVIVSLCQFDPSTVTRTKLNEWLLYFLDHSGGREHFTGLHLFDQYHEMALLSPDCKTLLLPQYSCTIATYDLVDAVTGQKRCTLELPPIQIGATYTTLIEAAFSEDSKSLLVQTEDRAGDRTNYVLRVYDAATGKVWRSLRLPGSESLGNTSSSWRSGYSGFDHSSRIWQNKSRLGKVLYFDGSQVIADHNIEFEEGPKGIMSVDFATQQVRKIALDEFRLSEEELHKLSRKSGSELSPQIVNQWNHQQRSVVSIAQFLEGNRYLPIICFSSRDANDGHLLSTTKVAFPNNDFYQYLEPCKLLALLPDTKLLLKEIESVPVKDSVVSRCFESISRWLHFSGPRKFTLFNATTGYRDYSLYWDVEVVATHLSTNGKTLALYGNDDESLFIKKYAYPFSKPWMLVIAWSLGIAIGVFLIRESCRYIINRPRLHVFPDQARVSTITPE
ncbi:MAG: hypothetical protein U0796_20380 [Gemmatales bacterium]